jgi:4-amino-4-deoxy-L-arabinose transferase-like glycosyltransferase
VNVLGRIAAGARACLRAWRRIPRAGRACFVIAFVNVAIWSVIIPPFQVPDEISHFAYAQYFAETGAPPPQGVGAQYSPQENAALLGLDWGTVIGIPSERGIMTVPQDRQLRALLRANPDPLGPGGGSPATNQPPLYYALEAIPYWLSPSNDILTRLAFMRLVSALMAAGTVLAVFMFLRELMPGTPWAWTVGALMVAFQPMFDFIGAGVQGDNLLYLASALTCFTIARAWRRGLTVGRSVAIGGALALGMLAKLTFLALLPGAGLALLLLTWRARTAGPRAALRMLAAGVAVAAAPVGLYVLLNVTLWNRGSPLAGALVSVTAGGGGGGAGAPTIGWNATLDYTWQLFLPPLGFMNHIYFGQNPLWPTWFDGAVGRFGWLDYSFPAWVYTDLQDLVYALAALAAIALLRVRGAIRGLLPLFGCFAVMALGLVGIIGYLGIRYTTATGYPFAQARYLFPLLVFYALAIVLATKALPRRWAPVLGGLLVVLAMAHSLFGETLTISRYYG